MTAGMPPGAPGVSDGLGAEARALLDAARDGLSPDAAALRRVHARVQVATAGAAAGTAIGVKLGLALVITAAAITAGVYALRGAPEPAVDPGPRATTSAPIAAAAPARSVAAAPARTVAPTAGSDDDLIVIEPTAAPPVHASPAHPAPVAPIAAALRAADAHAPTGAHGRAGIALGREVELIDQAMAALRSGDAPAALRIVRAYTAEAAGAGQLGQDAAAIEIEALCRLGDPAARDRRAAFDARFPRSAQRARLQAACR